MLCNGLVDEKLKLVGLEENNEFDLYDDPDKLLGPSSERLFLKNKLDLDVPELVRFL